jgi:hypothetical protein
LRDVRDSYLAGEVIPLPAWLDDVKTPETARIKEVERNLTQIIQEREKQRSTELESEIKSLGKSQPNVQKVNPEVLKMALGDAELGPSASRAAAPAEGAPPTLDASRSGHSAPPPARTTTQLKTELKIRLKRLGELKRLFHTQPTDDKEVKDRVRHNALALQMAFALSAHGDDSPLTYCRKRSLIQSHRTWKLLPFQFILFALGVCMLGAGLAWQVQLPETGVGSKSKQLGTAGTQAGAPADHSVSAGAPSPGIPRGR